MTDDALRGTGLVPPSSSVARAPSPAKNREEYVGTGALACEEESYVAAGALACPGVRKRALLGSVIVDWPHHCPALAPILRALPAPIKLIETDVPEHHA